MNSQPDSTHPFADWHPIPEQLAKDEITMLHSRFPKAGVSLEQSDLGGLRIRKQGDHFTIGRVKGQTIDPLINSEEEKQELPGALNAFRARLAERKARIYLLAGFGAGLTFRALAREIGSRNYPLLVIEPDAALFRAVLTTGVFTDLLQNGRLFFAAGKDWLDQAEQILRQYHLYTEAELCLVLRSSKLSEEEKSFYTQALNDLASRKAKIEQEMNRQVMAFLEKKRAHKPDSIKKLWLCEHSAASARYSRAQWHLARRLEEDLKEAGLEIVRPEFEPDRYHPSFFPVHSLMEANPDAALILNAFSTQTAVLGKPFSEKYLIPKVSWFLDSPVVLAEQAARFGLAPGDILLSADSRWFEDIADISPDLEKATIHYLQAAATFRDFGQEDNSWKCPVSYVGQVRPVFDWENLKKADPAFASIGEELIKTLADGNRLRLPEMARQVSSALPNVKPDRVLSILRRYYTTVIWEATSRRRISFLEAAAVKGLRLLGNEAWPGRSNSRALKEAFTGKTIEFENLPRLYRNSTINLNFHHLQCSDCLNIRCFDVPVSGGFLLTEYLPGLENYFQIGKEVDVFHTPEELAEKIDYYLQHPQERREIAERGRERVLRDHTYLSRWDTIKKIILRENA